MPEQKHYRLRWWAEDGWQVESALNLHDNRNVEPSSPFGGERASTKFTIYAGETVRAKNRVVVEISSVGRSMPLYVKMDILG